MMERSPLRILHVSSGNLYGGVENTLSILSKQHHWDGRLERHFALCFTGRLSEEIEASESRLALLGKVRVRFPWQILRARLRLRRLLRCERFDAVICHMVWNLFLFGRTVRRADLPLIFWMHDVASGDHWLERLVRSARPDLVIVNSEFTAGTLPKLFPNPPLHRIIHPPVMPPHGRISSSEREQIRAEHGAAPHDVLIMQVGRMEPYKGHEPHLDALGLLKKTPNWLCWIVGGAQRAHEREYVLKLQQRAAAAGIAPRIRFLGERNDVARLLAAADIFCQPNTRGEPFGVVFSEALYAGLPVVATAIGGALEIVNESCGRLVPPGDAVALASTLSQLIDSAALRSELGKNGPARAKSLSDPDLVMTRLEAAVCEAIEIHPSAQH